MQDMTRRTFIQLMALGVGACSVPLVTFYSPVMAATADHVLTLNHHELSEPDFTASVGDRIRIVNAADIAHSIYVTYGDGRIVSLDTQLPGTEKSFVLEAAGTVLLRCWIHPVIRQQLQVTPAQ
ncbi:plastocyanin [Advenella incenata]|uniref:Plastocyanin n=1 Tax=Advenella incenata TaxID=267800 RepID=A0A4Q7V9T2_9BURK|nr:hypothetical protein [Advenella incenata]RZT91452.1 plastocyanin [Advenella incenata]